MVERRRLEAFEISRNRRIVKIKQMNRIFNEEDKIRKKKTSCKNLRKRIENSDDPDTR